MPRVRFSLGKDISEMSLDELNEKEDDIDSDDERAFEAYRRQRLQELRAKQDSLKFGSVLEISKVDWTREINQADERVHVLVHIYKPGLVYVCFDEDFSQHSLTVGATQPAGSTTPP